MLEKFPVETCHEAWTFKNPLTDEHSRKGRDRERGEEKGRERGKGGKEEKNACV